jgi:hypothetical protein
MLRKVLIAIFVGGLVLRQFTGGSITLRDVFGTSDRTISRSDIEQLVACADGEILAMDIQMDPPMSMELYVLLSAVYEKLQMPQQVYAGEKNWYTGTTPWSPAALDVGVPSKIIYFGEQASKSESCSAGDFNVKLIQPSN